jgi:CheY-like chemotaxis protein
MSGPDVGESGDSTAILAVDDVQANLLALSGILEPLRTRLVTAASGREALEVAGRDQFAVILLDVMMPDMDGFETLGRLRAIPAAQNTPVILLTAYELDALAMDRVQGMGLVDYILKPVAPAFLRSKVAALVSFHRRGAELRDRDEALAAKDRDIAMLAHDLQNPLTAIATSATFLVRAALDPRHHNAADRIARGVTRMSEMIHNLTDYARAGRGPIPVTRAPMDLGDLCRELVDESRQVDSGRNIDLTCAGSLRGEWDRARISQALSNLLGNAYRYRGRGTQRWRAHPTRSSSNHLSAI